MIDMDPKLEEQAKALLLAAADLLEPPGAWIKGTFARRSDGVKVSSIDRDASCWCASGAMTRALYNVRGGSVYDAAGAAVYDAAVKLLTQSTKHPLVAIWNDTVVKTQAEAVQALRKAAA